MHTLIKNRIETKVAALLEECGIQDPPINLRAVAKHLDLEIMEDKFEDALAGVLLRDEKVIAVNTAHSEARKNFSIAHEIGHYVLHKNLNEFFDGVYKREKIENTANNVFEMQANEFAAALLMPKTKVIHAIQQSNKLNGNIISELASQFKVSEQAMSFRLLNLGFLLNH